MLVSIQCDNQLFIFLIIFFFLLIISNNTINKQQLSFYFKLTFNGEHFNLFLILKLFKSNLF